jgi:hypothetical protein
MLPTVSFLLLLFLRSAGGLASATSSGSATPSSPPTASSTATGTAWRGSTTTYFVAADGGGGSDAASNAGTSAQSPLATLQAALARAAAQPRTGAVTIRVAEGTLTLASTLVLSGAAASGLSPGAPLTIVGGGAGVTTLSGGARIPASAWAPVNAAAAAAGSFAPGSCGDPSSPSGGIAYAATLPAATWPATFVQRLWDGAGAPRWLQSSVTAVGAPTSYTALAPAGAGVKLTVRGNGSWPGAGAALDDVQRANLYPGLLSHALATLFQAQSSSLSYAPTVALPKETLPVMAVIAEAMIGANAAVARITRIPLVFSRPNLITTIAHVPSTPPVRM